MPGIVNHFNSKCMYQFIKVKEKLEMQYNTSVSRYCKETLKPQNLLSLF